MKGVGQTLVAVALGTLSGLLVLAFGRPDTDESAGSPATADEPTVVVQRTDEAALRDARNRIARLEARLGEAATDGATAEDPGHAGPERRPTPSPEEELATVEEEWQANVSSFETETTDPVWAREAKEALSPGLEDVASRFGGTLASLDCRTTTCAADLSWPDAASSHRGSEAALHASLGLNCRHHMRLDPEDRTTHLILDCADYGQEQR